MMALMTGKMNFIVSYREYHEGSLDFRILVRF